MRRRKRRLGVTAAGTVLAALAVATPAHAAAGGAAAGGAAGRPGTCTPSITVLASLPGPGGDPAPWAHDSQVNGIGPRGLSVGVSHGQPVYWLGTRVRRVPLPAGYTAGTVEAVNRYGLMAGTLTGPGRGPAAFSYRPGARAVTLLPGGGYAKDINDRGHIAGYRQNWPEPSTGLEWSGRRLLRTLPLPAHVQVGEVSGINNAGQIVGQGYGVRDGEGYDVALLWSAAPGALPAELPPIQPGDTYSRYEPREIDERGRIVGTYSFSRTMESNGVRWAPPYTEMTDAGNLPERTQGSLEDSSPTSGVSVGTASDSSITGPWPPETAPPTQAQYWPGSGPMLALPRLSPVGHAAAYTVTDGDRVGGSAGDARGAHAVIWNCASRQAYRPSAAP